ncbi:MAG TPA: AAA family ATPase [Streptosporangiaceae bacterium]|nr:AAA family ATPase [Streptosporangiaceae bacterium]
MNWQAGPPAGGSTGDLFAQTEAAVRALVAAPWWRSAPPAQRADVVTSHMLAGAGEWWLYGAWGRWYRSGLDGSWHPCPAPVDPAARRTVGIAPRGAGNPPVPPQLIPAGPDLAAGRVTPTGFLSGPPRTAVVARVQQALITALSVNPAQFALHDPVFAAGTPSTVAAAWGALLWCAGSPVALAEHPLIELIAPYLTIPRAELRWMTAPDLTHLAGYYCERLGAGDAVGAAHVVRVIAEIAAALRTDPAFRPGAHALDAIAAATTQMIRLDMGGVRFGVAAVAEQWRRRCPPEFAPAVMREAAPGEFFRLALYDLEETVGALYRDEAGPAPAAPPTPTAIRHAAMALLAADMRAAPAAAIAAVVPWLDPDSARTLQAVAAHPQHPLRRLWPHDGRLPGALRAADPAHGEGAERDSAARRTARLEALLAGTYALDLAWCRLAQLAPPASGFAVPAAAAAELRGAAAAAPKRTGEMTAWQIIEAARAHLAAGRVPPSPPASPAPPVAEAGEPEPEGDAVGEAGEVGRPAAEPPAPPSVEPAAPPDPTAADAPPEPAPAAPAAADETAADDVAEPFRPVADAIDPPVGPPVPGPPPPDPAALGVPHVVEAYGIRFLCGLDDVERLLTELRRRGQWARRLRDQEVSSASAPGLVLVGAPSSGQRRLARMVGRALADVGIGDGDLRRVDAAELRERGPGEVRAVLDEHAGHTVLLDGLDALVFDEEAGSAFAAALYRARVEGVSQTTLIATCPAERAGRLSEAHPELVSDLRIVRLPDLSDPAARVALLELLARERRLDLFPDAWEVARRDLGRMRGRGRLAGARLVETYLDRAATRHLGQAADTQDVYSGDDAEALTLVPSDFEGVAEELEPSLRDLEDVDTYLAELRSLAGLRPVKDAVERIVAEARVAAARRRAGLPVGEQRRHLGFAGDAGTGKTTVARLIGKLFAVIGPLESGHLVECAAADLTAADEVADLVKAKVSEAMGGVLVLEQELTPGETAAAATTAMTTVAAELTALMDDRRDEFIVIVTGGRDELPGFLDAVPSLRDRLAEVIVFPDPGDDDLVEIFRRHADEQRYVLEDALVAALPERMAALRAAPGYAGGHSVRRLFDEVVARQSVRIVRAGATMSADHLTLLTAADLPA